MSRTIILILMTLVPTVVSSQNLENLRTDIRQMLSSAEGTFAVAFKTLDGSADVMINERAMFHAASTMKTPVMIEVFHQAEEGRFRLDDSLTIRNEFKSIVDGSPYQLDLGDDSDESMYKRIGGKVSIRELVCQMITVSSNLATNILIQLVDARNVTATMRKLGAPDIEVLRGVEDSKAFEKGLNNRTSAHDLALVFRALAVGKAGNQSSSREMTDILLAQKFRDIIPALLPPDVKVAHKTGSINGVEHDSGIVILPDGRRYILVVLSKDLKDAAKGKAVLAAVSRRIFDFMMEAR
ncbi:MAG: class A beta-lactamase-related serine hydrolase [Ignavibacteriales bacterium]|nr:class A beta-lactamase-related serine hydrolase [Ignavibacteriales bacterium]